MEVDAKDKQRKTKIQFSVPSAVPLQLDPQQVEMIRRRRPTPATLFHLTDHPSPEEEHDHHQWVIGENGVFKPKRVNANVYQPPSLKAVQKMAQAHMKSLGTCRPEEPDDLPGEDSPDLSPVSTSDSQEDQSGRFPGTKINSKGRFAHFLPLSVSHGEKEEEEQEESDKPVRIKKGE
ncbi:protein phosphatase 1 regulatory subunit 1B [Esox lucius]|uniref:Protein phosphatase 1 regulatory subunit 1B n=1 Tax=Esox lucius TaxID=8010 RepID=A0AAY5L6X2_ESOLU|nr:protein phosphatase 1 regulatory subunit 1B [Esox lucius]